MNFWLVKSEPEEYGWEHIVKDKIATWDGVRNYQARNFLKEMKKCDWVLIYHTGETKEIVGVCEVYQEFFQDPKTDDANWVAVKLKPVQLLKQAVSLAIIKANEKITELHLLRNGRLSVMPVVKAEFNEILKLSNTKLK